MSLDDYFKRSMQQLEVEGGINCENNDGDVPDDINYESDDGKETNDDPIEGGTPTCQLVSSSSLTFHHYHLHFIIVITNDKYDMHMCMMLFCCSQD